MARYHDEDVLRELYWDEGMSVQDIADHFDKTYSTIHKWMRKNGVERRKPTHEKPAYFCTTKDGYEKWETQSYDTKHNIAVHRLLMVAEHGVEAVKGMEVHHKNRIPWDNRPSNLEVVTSEEHWEITGEQMRIDAADISDETLREYIYAKSMSINDIVEEEGCKKLAVERCLEQSPVWRRFLPQSDDQIVVYVVENNSIDFATDYFGYVESTIKQRLRAAGRHDLIPNGRIPLEDRFDKDELQRLYHDEGYKQKEIAEKYDTTAGRISQIFSRLDIPTRSQGPEKDSTKQSFLGEDMEQPWQDEEILREEYVKNGNGYRVLGDAWGCCQRTIRKWVEKFGFEKHAETEYVDCPWQDEDTLREMYHDQQMTQQEIADEFGCSSPTIKKWLDRHDIETRTTGETLKMK